MPPPSDRSALTRARAWHANVADVLPLKRIGLFAGAATVALVGVYGDWSGADAVDAVPMVAVREAASATPFQVTVQRARVFDGLDGVFYAEEGYRYIVVMLDVENTTDEFVASSVLAQAVSVDAPGLRTIELRDGPSVQHPRVVRTVDSLTQATFQPGLPSSVILVWQQEDSADIPAEVTVTLSAHTWRRSTLDGSMGWRDPVPALRATVPLDPLEASEET